MTLWRTTLLRLIIFSLPFQLGYHYWPPWAYIYGIRVDYLAPTIYFTDILVLLFVFTDIKFIKSLNKLKKWIIAILVIAFLNIFFANSPTIALIKWLKVLELSLFAGSIAYVKFDKYKEIIVPLSLSLIIISLLGIAQFLNEGSLGGVYWLLGERTFTINSVGIALGEMWGRVYLRPYSTFSHPNSFAGYLLVSLLLVYILGKRKNIMFTATIAVSLTAFVLCASLSAFIACLVVLVIILFQHNRNLSLLMLAPTFADVYERVKLAEVSIHIFKSKPFLGVGLNNFILALSTTKVDSRVLWKLQPVHNIFLLVLSELGIIGVAIFSFIIFKTFKNKKFTIILVAILTTGMFDHYWLTLQQNQLLLGLVLGIIFNKSITNNHAFQKRSSNKPFLK